MEEIVFDHVWFTYEKEPVLRDLSVRILKNSMTAIIGTSGKGKSTMMKLMLNLIQCEKGEIYFKTQEGQVPIDAGTRKLFAYVPQGNMIFSGTVEENIAFACKNVTEEEIMQAAEAACLKALIEKLPYGLVFQKVKFSDLPLPEQYSAMLRFYCWMNVHLLWMKKQKSRS